MSEAKIEIKIGEIQFSGEGDKEWLSEQLTLILDKAKELVELSAELPSNNPISHSDPSTHQPADFSNNSSISKQTLASFLKLKNASTPQVDKFLATAIWCEAKGKNRLKSGDITTALRNANQTKLSNAAEALKQNVSKGFCEREGKEFFVTQEGKDKIGA